MPGGIIYQIAEDFNREVKAMTRRASSEIVRAYGEIWKKLNAEILRLTKEYQASNSKDALLWLNERGRLRVLQAQIEVELRKFADRVNQETRAAQDEVIREAQLRATESVAALARQSGVDLFWNTIDPRVLTQMVGVLQKGSPLDKILRGYGDEAVVSMGNKLLNGLAMGLGPREIARNIRIDMAMDLTRALRISRTEIIRAKRESSRLSYKENPKLIGGYIRRSARQSSTCAACWALDGVIYPLDTPLDDHPNGMCYEVPYIPELDKFYDRSDTGASAFEKLSDDEKREILGPAKFLAWKEGKFELKDLVVHTHNDKWGDMATEASLKSLVGEDEAKKLLMSALGLKDAQSVIESSKISFERVMDYTEQPIKPEQIDFTALDKVQYVANLGDQRGLYSVDDPGREYVRDLPVYLNQFGTTHLVSDDMHLLRIHWISRNASDFVRAIEKPEIIEKTLRPKRSGGYSTSHIVKVSNPTNTGDEFMLVSIWLSPKIEGGYHQIITIHPLEKRRLFKADGSIRDKYMNIQ